MTARRMCQGLALGTVLALGAGLPAAAATTFTGAGGTAIYPVLARWAYAYHGATGTIVNYQPIGSGGGIRQIEARTVSFANSDMPLKSADLKAHGLIQFPQVIIAITPVVNLPGVKAGDLVLTGPVLADIYLGKITHWNDPAIARLNRQVKLPDLAITAVHRSDGSGTTFNFTDYLSKVSPAWKARIGADTAVSWVGGIGGKGNAGVASFVQQVKGAIGYVEYAYAMENHLAYTDLVNAAGKRVVPNMDSFAAAAKHADFSKVQNFHLILTDQPGEKSWPIIAATFMLLRQDGAAATNHAVLEFLDWALHKGQAQATALDYVPLPPELVETVEKSWTADLGEAIWPGAKK